MQKWGVNICPDACVWDIPGNIWVLDGLGAAWDSGGVPAEVGMGWDLRSSQAKPFRGSVLGYLRRICWKGSLNSSGISAPKSLVLHFTESCWCFPDPFYRETSKGWRSSSIKKRNFLLSFIGKNWAAAGSLLVPSVEISFYWEFNPL